MLMDQNADEILSDLPHQQTGDFYAVQQGVVQKIRCPLPAIMAEQLPQEEILSLARATKLNAETTKQPIKATDPQSPPKNAEKPQFTVDISKISATGWQQLSKWGARSNALARWEQEYCLSQAERVEYNRQPTDKELAKCNEIVAKAIAAGLKFRSR